MDLLLRWGADETNVNDDGITPSQLIPDVAQASEQRRPKLERLTKLLAHALQDRTWRRRGFVAMCRALPDRLRLAAEIPDRETGDIGQRLPEERPSCRARTGQAEVDLLTGGTHVGGRHACRWSGRRGHWQQQR